MRQQICARTRMMTCSQPFVERTDHDIQLSHVAMLLEYGIIQTDCILARAGLKCVPASRLEPRGHGCR